jgi:hypothetical protein
MPRVSGVEWHGPLSARFVDPVLAGACITQEENVHVSYATGRPQFCNACVSEALPLNLYVCNALFFALGATLRHAAH